MTPTANFIRESNAIEGILREPTSIEIEASERFIRKDEINVSALNELQVAFAPGMPLRDVGMNVRVGQHVALPGGPDILKRLESILGEANKGDDPWRIHCRFEMLHPYMDGNGRTGRMLWAWNMRRINRDPFALPFLQRFYYQTLENSH